MDNLYIIIAVAVFVVLAVAVTIANIIAARIIFWNTLTRKKKDSWNNTVSYDNPELKEMYEEGTGYIKQFADKKIKLHTINEGFNLYAEYYDFGFDRAARSYAELYRSVM